MGRLIREDIETLLDEGDAILEALTEIGDSPDRQQLVDYLYEVELRVHRALRGSPTQDCWCAHCSTRKA